MTTTKPTLRLLSCPQCGYDRQEHAPDCSADTVPRQPGQVPPGHPDAGKAVGWGEHPRDCDCGDCP